MKLLAFGDTLFRAGTLTKGDLLIHPRVFNETRRWPQFKKSKYKTELELLGKIRATPNLRPSSQNETDRLELIILATMDNVGISIGSADRDQLASAIHCAAEIVTNDKPFADVAEALEVVVHSAEAIVIAAHQQGVLSKEEIQAVRRKWEANSEKRCAPDEARALDRICAKSV